MFFMLWWRVTQVPGSMNFTFHIVTFFNRKEQRREKRERRETWPVTQTQTWCVVRFLIHSNTVSNQSHYYIIQIRKFDLINQQVDNIVTARVYAVSWGMTSYSMMLKVIIALLLTIQVYSLSSVINYLSTTSFFHKLKCFPLAIGTRWFESRG